MATQGMHRGRLIDHVQLVVPDLAGTRRFYAAVFEVLPIPIGGEGDGFFDPAGNNIEAVHHGDAKRSAPSVKLTF